MTASFKPLKSRRFQPFLLQRGFLQPQRGLIYIISDIHVIIAAPFSPRLTSHSFPNEKRVFPVNHPVIQARFTAHRLSSAIIVSSSLAELLAAVSRAASYR